MGESCPGNKTGIALWHLHELWLRNCYMLITGRRQSIPTRTATTQMLKAVNRDPPSDSAGWWHAFLSHFCPSHWGITWFNNFLSLGHSCPLHLCWIQRECDLNVLYIQMTLELVTFVAGLQYFSPRQTVFTERYTSVSAVLFLSDCIFGRMYSTTYPMTGEH